MSTKAITVTGGYTAKDMTETGDIRARRKTNRRRKTQGGDEEYIHTPTTTATVNLTKLDTTLSPDSIMHTSQQPQQSIQKIQKQINANANANTTRVSTNYQTSHENETTHSTGGAHRPLKVELRHRQTPKKVHLKPKKGEPVPHQESASSQQNTHRKTQKARKITLGVSSLRRRLTHAKKIRDKVKEVPIEKLREQLIEKGLLKKGNKTPDAIVRQIAADAQIIISKGL